MTFTKKDPNAPDAPRRYPKMPTKQEMLDALAAAGITKIGRRMARNCHTFTVRDAYMDLAARPAPTHLSFTQVNMFLRCQRQYYYRYVRELKLPPIGRMTLGSAMDETENHHYREKIRTETDEPLDVLRDVYHTKFGELRGETDWQGDDPEKVEMAGDNLVRIFREQVAPVTEPVAVQERIEVSFEKRRYTFVGVLDLVAQEARGSQNGLTVIDNKTSARAPSQATVDRTHQLTAYASMHAWKNKLVTVPVVGLDVLVNKTNAEAVRLRSTRTQAEIDRWWRTVDLVWKQIGTGDFMPCSPTEWVCTPQQCGYYKLCKEEF